MANTLGAYDPIFYATEALRLLYNNLGMAQRVHLGYDAERRSFQKGSVVQIRKPSTFTAQATTPGSSVTKQDVTTSYVNVTLDKFFDVTFPVSDSELAYTTEQIIIEHIEPAVMALAQKIDTDLNALYSFVPHVAVSDISEMAGNTTIFIAAVREVQQWAKCPLSDIARMHFEVDPTTEALFLSSVAFSQQQGAGDVGVNTQLTGSLGRKLGYEVFANQNVPSYAHSAAFGIGNPTVEGNHLKGDSTVLVDSGAATGALKVGDIITIADSGDYAITVAVPDISTDPTISISPPLRVNVADTKEIAVKTTIAGLTGYQNLAFHRNAFALVTAPLSMIGNNRGAQIQVARDPVSGLTMRSSGWYNGDLKQFFVSLDVLYGVACLDPDMAARGVLKA